MDGFSYRESRWSHSSGYAQKQIVAVYVDKNGDSYKNIPKYKKGFLGFTMTDMLEGQL